MTSCTPRHKPHLNIDLPGNGLLLRQACSPASNKFVPQSKSLFTGRVSHCDNNGKSQVFVVPGF